MRSAYAWHTVKVEYERINVRAGEWVQLAHTDRDGKLHVIEFRVDMEGNMDLTTDLPVQTWREWGAK